ncbi:MAG: hypothetical protein NTY53_14375 [Kiritimatiellaeota bacterium]|nr:hypothetical protein [Kiritimatiellota bacterium]
MKKKMAAKQGIALIVVLALLAMLVIMAVSFVVFMRTERTASRDYAEMVKARNIAQAAVTRALVHMQQDMNLSNQFYHGGYVYVPTSAGAERCTNWASPDLLLDHYVPGSVNQAALNTALKSTGPVFWTNLVIKTIGGANQLIGRYSYMVFDGSDFLDINTISNQVRGSGNYPGEVAMPAEITSPSVLVQERDTVRHPFESLCEVNLRTLSHLLLCAGGYLFHQ